jgi:ubiquinone/menaquinone biosynthesis C-methylase UbiE
MNFIKAIYYKFFPSSTAAHRLFWRLRFLLNKNSLDSTEIDTSLDHAHRQEIINEFNKFSCIKNVLEIGSSWGPNLLLLNRYYPEVKFTGIDISRQRINLGNEYISANNIENIKLRYMDMTSLAEFRDNEFDLVISDAALIYIDNKHINSIAHELNRITTKGLIMVEFDDDSEDSFGCVYEATWIRDYKAVFSKYSDKIEKKCISGKIWPGKWSVHGKIITVFFNIIGELNERIIENN